ncbi:uncharacterized protein LOC119361424 [Triticum dicoccoides]|nr:uncharacterized protein LOC119361424 [Triticum dicoccoides]
MAPKVLPRECLPRRSPTGGFEPITVYVRVDGDGNYLLRHPYLKGGRACRDLEDLKDAVRAFYTGKYISAHRRNRRRSPPPSSTDEIFQFEFVVDRAEPADVSSSLKESLKATTLEEKSFSSLMAASPSSGVSPPGPGSRIWQRERHGWGFGYYIRLDLGGSFHTYPYAGGPFQSLEEVDKAMDSYFHQHRDPKLLMNQGGVPSLEISIEKALYWPDGRRKKRSRSYMIQQVHNRMRRLLQALVDKHNEDHSLLGDLAYELKDVVHCKTIFETRTNYYHLNFTMTKEAGDSNCGNENLFFAEVKCVRQGKEEEMLVSCFRVVESTNNGHCYGCTKDGDVNMKHPNSAGEYLAGHLKVGSPFGHCYVGWSSDSDDEDMEAKKEKIRYSLTGVADPKCMKMFTLPPSAFDDEDD